MPFIFKLPPLSLCVLLAWSSAARAESRFLVAYVDGERTSVAEAEMPWMAGDAKLPETGAVRLKDRPMRWIRDPQQSQIAPAGPAVEFFGGDVLPAKVLAYEKGAESPAGSEAARSYLLVEPAAVGDETADKPPSVRVSTAWIKRVVWEPRRGTRYEPGSLFFRDGRQTSFRAARWTEGGVRLLEEHGTVLVTFDQIAELHFPLADPWSTYLGQLAILSPEAAAWLLHIETVGGLKATASTTRSRVQHASPPATGGPSLLLQPAWCLDPLVVPCSGASGWTFFAPDEVPLSSLVPRRAVQRAMLGAGWPQYTIDANIQGGPLRSGGEQFGWGFGVHAYSQLEFDLPPFARSFTVHLGLDEAAGSGGCVRATVSVAGSHAATLFASSAIVGSSETIATGPLKLDDQQGGAARLRLVVDPLAAGRPPRADPLDIRDTFDWLEPLVQLDPDALRHALSQRSAETLVQLAGWSLPGEAGQGWRVVNQPRSAAHPQRGFRLMLEATTSPLVLRRKLRIEAGRDQLEWLCRPLLAEGAACTVQVAAGGKQLDHLRIAHDEQMSGPRRTSLASFVGRDVEVSLTLTTAKTPLIVDWERLELVAGEPAKPAKP
jgi:hypothetical protein